MALFVNLTSVAKDQTLRFAGIPFRKPVTDGLVSVFGLAEDLVGRFAGTRGLGICT